MANNATTPPLFITGSSDILCPSLEQTDLILSTRNRSSGTAVALKCDQFGHRPSGNTQALLCMENGTWSRQVPQCEWTWDFKTQDKIIFVTSVAAVSFFIIVIVVIVVAYFCCYKKRKESEERLHGSSVQGSSPQVGGVDGPYHAEPGLVGVPADPYMAYHNGTEKYDGYATNGSMPDKMWLGYIPRPKVSEGRIYN